MRYFVLLLLVPLLQCSQKQAPEINPELLKNKLWAHDFIPDSNGVFPNFQMVWSFNDAGSVYKDFWEGEEYRIHADTLTIIRTGNQSKENQQDTIYFKAEIQNLTPNSLQLLCLSGNFYFKKNQHILFYHEQLNYDSSLIINKITFSTRSCIWGTCPILKLEILPDRSITFEGVENTRQFKGAFQGIIADSMYLKIENNLKLANVTTIDTLLPGIIDGQRFELIIDFNNDQQKRITGSIDDFYTSANDVRDIAGYRRLQGAVQLLTGLYLETPLQKSGTQNKIPSLDENSEN